MSEKIVKKVIVLVMVFAMAALLSPTISGKVVYAATNSTAQGIYDALIAEGSAFSNAKKQNEEYFIYNASLEDNRITITVNPTEEYAEYYNQYNTGNDSCYYDVGDDGYVSCTSGESDYKTELYLQAYIADAVAGYLKMDREIINKYMLAAQIETRNQTENASGNIVIDTQYYKVSQPDEHGLTDIKLYAGEKYSDSVVNELLDRVYFDEKTVKTLDVEALTDTYTSSVVNTGKYGAVIDGNKYKVKMYFYVYGSDIDHNAYESIKNLVAALKPVGYDDFAAKYNKTSTEGGNVAATRTEWSVYPPSADDIQERFGGDTSFDISKHTFLAVEFRPPGPSAERRLLWVSSPSGLF